MFSVVRGFTALSRIKNSSRITPPNLAPRPDLWVMLGLVAGEGRAVAAEGEHRQGDHGSGGLEAEGHPGRESDLRVGGYLEPTLVPGR